MLLRELGFDLPCFNIVYPVCSFLSNFIVLNLHSSKQRRGVASHPNNGNQIFEPIIADPDVRFCLMPAVVLLSKFDTDRVIHSLVICSGSCMLSVLLGII